MCTLAWGVSGKDLWVCFNRDEQRNRPEADLPRVSYEGRYPVAYARDPLGEGTWLAVSGAGFVVAVMNQYSGNHEDVDAPRSRGRIVTGLVQSESSTEAEKTFLGMKSLNDYAPFYLFVLSHKEGRQWSWDGKALKTSEECPSFWTTSSFKPKEIELWRTREWANLTGNGDISLKLTTRIFRMGAAHPAFGMTMDRDDARTVSQTTVNLSQGKLHLEYAKREVNGVSFEKPVICQWQM